MAAELKYNLRKLNFHCDWITENEIIKDELKKELKIFEQKDQEEKKNYKNLLEDIEIR